MMGAYLEYPFSRGSTSPPKMSIRLPTLTRDFSRIRPIFLRKSGRSREFAKSSVACLVSEANLRLPSPNSPSARRLLQLIFPLNSVRRLRRRRVLRRGIVPGVVGGGNATEDAAPNGADSTGRNKAQEIKDREDSAEDDKAIEQWVREKVETTWH